jgi:tRNA-(ms[2]io[6]A)-hydroxylase
MDSGAGARDPAAMRPAPAAGPALHAACALAAETPPTWAERALQHLPELLVDQAHLEKKAAAAALRLSFELPSQAATQERADLLQALSVLAREELVHFERALRLLLRRGIALRPQRPAVYAERLKAACARAMPARLVDSVLVAALIEARSHERMAALAVAASRRDAEVAAFWSDLVEAEARHRCVYLDVAAALAGPAAVLRWPLLAAHEAAVLADAPFEPRLHGGLGADGVG